jgi:hypothetical protein
MLAVALEGVLGVRILLVLRLRRSPREARITNSGTYHSRPMWVKITYI